MNGIRITEGEGNRHHRVELLVDGHSVSCAWIVHLTIRIGQVAVRMDGIGGVGTGDEYRHRGYSRRVLEAAVDYMVSGDAALSMLYGIPDYYHKFGFATAGPDHSIRLPLAVDGPTRPQGWKWRMATEADVTRLQCIHESACRGEVGSSIRPTGAFQWKRLADAAAGATQDACLVVEDPQGAVCAYAWQGKGVWAVDVLDRDDPAAAHFGEVMATSQEGAMALLASLYEWARGNAGDRTELRLSTPHDGVVAHAAALCDAEFRRQHGATGGSMARVLNVDRLVTALLPELSDRLARSRHPWQGCLRITTPMGDFDLVLAGGAVARAEEGRLPDLVAELPQQDLARLALGAYAPSSLASVREAGTQAGELLSALFPQRCPHMHLGDRY